ncbi:MAG: hypothetical protein IK085_11295 [Clostridia bacterium]|nr:hypothetical protein [Clostridia bacterium]
MSEISALPSEIAGWLGSQEALSGIRFTTEYPAERKSVPLARTIVSVGIDSVQITDTFVENNQGVFERDEYCRDALIRIRLGVHAPFSQGGEACYDAFTDVIDTLTFASDLEIKESGAGGVTADRDTDAFVLEAWIEVRANLCPAASCSVQFASFMNKDLLCGSHITDTDIHLSAAQREYLNSPVVTGTYFGTGSASRAVSLGFAPRAVFVAAQGMPGCVYDSATGKTDDYSASASRQAGSPGLSVSAGGFSVNSAAVGNCTPCLNEAGTDYFYIAWR